MIKVHVPGGRTLSLKYLVLDYNGTVAYDGKLLDGVVEKLNILAKNMQVYIITADTFGRAAAQCRGIDGQLKIISGPQGMLAKERFVQELGVQYVAAIGNGINDTLMLAQAALGILVIGKEGAALKAAANADIIVNDINDALGLLLNTQRLKATLRD